MLIWVRYDLIFNIQHIFDISCCIYNVVCDVTRNSGPQGDTEGQHTDVWCRCCNTLVQLSSTGEHVHMFARMQVRLLNKHAFYRWFYTFLRSTVHVPSDTLRTWKWSPTRGGGEMLSSMNLTNKQRNRKWEKTQKPKIRLVCVTIVFHIFTKSRIWSYGRYTHSGIRVRPKTMKQKHVRKKGYISQE